MALVLTEGERKSGCYLVRGVVLHVIRCYRVEFGHESRREGEDMCPVAEEHEEREVVAKDPFKKAGDGEQNTPCKPIGRRVSIYFIKQTRSGQETVPFHERQGCRDV